MLVHRRYLVVHASGTQWMVCTSVADAYYILISMFLILELLPSYFKCQ